MSPKGLAGGRAGRGEAVAAPASEAVRRAPASPRSLSSFLPRLTRKAFQKYGFASAALVTDWANIVGAELAGYSVPERLKWPRLPEAYADDSPAARTRPGATLVVRVEGARALDLQYRSRQVIERVNAYFGYRAVSELRLIQGPVAQNREHDQRRAAARPAPARSPLPAPAAVSDQDERGRLASALARLEAAIRANP